jgi:hypothetical protein
VGININKPRPNIKQTKNPSDLPKRRNERQKERLATKKKELMKKNDDDCTIVLSSKCDRK